MRQVGKIGEQAAVEAEVEKWSRERFKENQVRRVVAIIERLDNQDQARKSMLVLTGGRCTESEFTKDTKMLSPASQIHLLRVIPTPPV